MSSYQTESDLVCRKVNICYVTYYFCFYRKAG